MKKQYFIIALNLILCGLAGYVAGYVAAKAIEWILLLSI